MFQEVLIYTAAFIACFAISFYIMSYVAAMHVKPKKMKLKDLPSVSIIVPAWNEEKGIGDTIESLKLIDYPKHKLEIVIVDDGSKDRTYEVARKYQDKQVKVYKKKQNGGKFTALNFGIQHSKGEIVVSTDADNLTVSPDALKKMVYWFADEDVMCVAPAMAISNPKGILNRLQQVEYLLGVFLRKTFGSINAIHITPGAFSAYRRTFIKKHGGFLRAHLTEDMEMALRVQKYHYKIKNAVDAIIYTRGLGGFKQLLVQRRRWYVGLIRNLIDYRFLFSRKYGAMGVVVLPIAIFSVAISVVISVTMMFSILTDIIRDIRLFSLIDYNVFANFALNSHILSRAVFDRITDPMILFFMIFICILFFYMVFAKQYVKEHAGVSLSLVAFLLFYGFLFTIWWITSIIYAFFFYKKVTWR